MPATVTQLESSATPRHFVVNKPYQAIYRDLMNFFDQCAPSGGGPLLPFLSFSVQNALYTDIGMGEATLTSSNMGDRSVLLHVKVRNAGHDKAEVTTYSTRVGLWEEFEKSIETSLKSGSPKCP
jgi:hypothetical protein